MRGKKSWPFIKKKDLTGVEVEEGRRRGAGGLIPLDNSDAGVVVVNL